MAGDPKLTVTRSQIAAALEEWDNDAKKEGWEDRDDEDRHTETADYFMLLCRKHGAS